MEKKKLIYVALGGVVLYFLYNYFSGKKNQVAEVKDGGVIPEVVVPKNNNIPIDEGLPTLPITTSQNQILKGNGGLINPKGSKFNGAIISGNGVWFNDNKLNAYDMGRRFAPFGDFEITSIVSSQPLLDAKGNLVAPYEKEKIVSGKSVKIGYVVDIVLTKDIISSVNTKPFVIYN